MYKQRDIVLIPIPFTDLSSNKKRPVVVISNDDYNLSSNDIIVIAITSNIEFSNDYCIPIDNSNLENGILPKKSIVRCDKIYTLSKDIIIKNIALPDRFIEHGDRALLLDKYGLSSQKIKETIKNALS